MGCVCSGGTSKTVGVRKDVRGPSKDVDTTAHLKLAGLSCAKPFVHPAIDLRKRYKHGSPIQLLAPADVLLLCEAVVETYFKGALDPVTLAAISLIESAGRHDLLVYKEDLNDVSVGLCQMLVSTAKWLATAKGFNKLGVPTQDDLQDPGRCLYYGAAYLSVLSRYDGRPRPEWFVVKAYHAGPKASHYSSEAVLYWDKYCKAKALLRRLRAAMEESAAAARAPGRPGVTMHVVQAGESLPRIAAVCGVGVRDILAANPELPDELAVQPNDCIALPVAVLLPRVYVTQPGDTVHGIAKAHGVSSHRLLSRNPELHDGRRLQPGWVLLLPGLRGEPTPQPEPAPPFEAKHRRRSSQSAAQPYAAVHLRGAQGSLAAGWWDDDDLTVDQEDRRGKDAEAEAELARRARLASLIPPF